MLIYFVTSNKAKVAWVNRKLKGSGIRLVQKPMNFQEGRNIDVKSVVRNKAKQALKYIDKPFIVNDSGFYIKALNDFPASQVKFTLNTIGVKGILKLMEDKEDRRAYFESALAYVKDGSIRIFSGRYYGSIATRALGGKTRGWSDLLRIYIPKGHSKTPAQMNDREWKDYQKHFNKIDPYFKFLKWIVKKQ